MKPRRLDVMLSSTTKDLPEHREKATKAAARAGFYVVQMENLTALPQQEDAISVSMAMVEEAEVYIGIFGMRYGFMPRDERNPNDVSITEMEYRRAKELGMPILIFLMSDNHPGPDTSGLSAREAKQIMDVFYEHTRRSEKKLHLFKKELADNHVIGFFASADELQLKVYEALQTPSLRDAIQIYIKKRELTNKASKVFKRVAPKVMIPHKPDLYAYPPYSGQNARFVGRRQELRLLDEWAKPESEHALLVLEAIGGMGKSALTWRWVQDKTIPFDGIFWYSFYEGGALMSDFVVQALAYVTQQDPFGLPQSQALAELIQALQYGRYLLVLDGLERVLVAYHRWNTAQMQNDTIEEGKDYRACTDPHDTDILRQLASCNPSRILITSRLMPAALEDSGHYLAGVRRVDLHGLSPQDARHLWREGGITWQDEGKLDHFINQFGRHSLLLKLMIDIIRKNKRVNNSFEKWYELYGANFDLFKDVKAKRYHILEFAYEGLSEEARTLLSQMAALGSAIDIDTLNVFNPYTNMPQPVSEPEQPIFWNEESEEDKSKQKAEYEKEKKNYGTYLQAKREYEKTDEFRQAIHLFDALLQDLEERGLIWWDADNLQYDLHPVVRGYAFSQLGTEDRPITYERIYNYFDTQEHGTYKTHFNSFKEMQNLIVMYNSLVGAGKIDQAAHLFIERMRYSLIEEGLGLYHKAYELLMPLFPNGLGALPDVDPVGLQRMLVNQMGGLLGYLNRNEEALLVRETELKNAFADITSNLIVAIHNFGLSLQSTNQLAQALKAYRYATTLIELTVGEENILYNYYRLIEIYIELGLWAKVKTFYQHVLEKPRNEHLLMNISRLFGLALIYQGADYLEIQAVLDQTEQLSHRFNDTRQHRLLNTTKGLMLLREKKYDTAINTFREAARIGFEQGLHDPDAWGGLAQTYAAIGNLAEALRIIEDNVADHGHSAAVVYLANGNQNAAREAALEFYTWAWAQGEPYVHRWHLEQAKGFLQQLNEPEPQLPVWSETNYIPFEYEDLIIKRIENLERQRRKRLIKRGSLMDMSDGE